MSIRKGNLILAGSGKDGKDAKLYSSTGQNTDGAMTQKAVTDALTIKNLENATNCITEIPQDIKLHLTNGTLVLEAGSKLHLADGNLDNTNITTNDISITHTNNGQYLVISTSSLYLAKTTSCLSGVIASRPSSLQDNTGLYFATDENKIYLTGDGGTTWYHGSGYSLPIAIVTVSNGTISSIDQVFNGFGYIGSTVFALPGVKGLIPNGRNADGSLNNIEVETSAVSTSSGGGENQKIIHYGLNSIGNIALNGGYSYDYVNNYNYDGSNKRTDAFFGKYDKTGGQIVNFQLGTTFHAVDYNDEIVRHTVVAFQEPTSSNNYTWYRKYSDGWVEQGGFVAKASSTTVTISLLVEMKDENWFFSTNAAANKTDANFNIAQGSAWDRTTVNFKTRCYTDSRKDWQVSGMAA